jgi:endo-beta-N-acetylglucosaminidase D
MLKEWADIKVLITDKTSCYYNQIGTIWNKGNGNLWQIEIVKGCGMYFSENQFKEITF